MPPSSPIPNPAPEPVKLGFSQSRPVGPGRDQPLADSLENNDDPVASSAEANVIDLHIAKLEDVRGTEAARNDSQMNFRTTPDEAPVRTTLDGQNDHLKRANLAYSGIGNWKALLP